MYLTHNETFLNGELVPDITESILHTLHSLESYVSKVYIHVTYMSLLQLQYMSIQWLIKQTVLHYKLLQAKLGQEHIYTKAT